MGEQSTDMQNEFYCFISYKHKKDGRFAEDQSWAEKLEGSFHRTKISVPPVAERAIIHGTSDDSNEYIGRVYRDFTNLSGGYYSDEIQSGLRCSRKLVSIVSDEMLADQNTAVQEAKGAKKQDIYSDAWCYREIRDFLSYPNHTLDDVILVYIGKQTEFTFDIVPYPLHDINLLSWIEQVFPNPIQNIAFKNLKSPTDKLKHLQDYWGDRNAIMALKEGEKTGLADLVAAKVASSIFGLKGESALAFISFREQELAREEAVKKKNRSQKTLLFVIIGVVFAIALLIGCLPRLRARREERPDHLQLRVYERADQLRRPVAAPHGSLQHPPGRQGRPQSRRGLHRPGGPRHGLPEVPERPRLLVLRQRQRYKPGHDAGLERLSGCDRQIQAYRGDRGERRPRLGSGAHFGRTAQTRAAVKASYRTAAMP